MKQVITILSLLLCAISVSAQSLVFSTSLENKAKSGDANAQVKLGKCYEYGLGVEEDSETAVAWYKKAAEKNNPDGLFHYGLMMFTGDGIAKNCKDGLNYLIQAKNNGQSEAQPTIIRLCSDFEAWGNYNIAPYEYVSASDLELINTKKAYLKTIAAKSTSASYYLALAAADSEDFKTAFKYLVQAHNLYYPDGKTFNENAIDEKDPLTGDETYAFVIEAYVQDALGYCYEYGLGCDIDYSRAIECYSTCDCRDGFYGNPGAFVPILRQALCYKKMGQIGKFIELLTQWKYCNDVSAYGGIPGASLWLAEAYYKGDGVKTDYTKAFELFKKLSESEEVMEIYSDVYADSCYRLSQMYTNGHGVTKNIDLAKLYYEEAVKYGCGIALYEYAKQKGML
jgi:hypothetical protein